MKMGCWNFASRKTTRIFPSSRSGVWVRQPPDRAGRRFACQIGKLPFSSPL